MIEQGGSFLVNWRLYSAVMAWRPPQNPSRAWAYDVRACVDWPATLRARSLMFRIAWWAVALEA